MQIKKAEEMLTREFGREAEYRLKEQQQKLERKKQLLQQKYVRDGGRLCV